MSKKKRVLGILNLSNLNLRRRFALLLGGIAAVSVVLFFIFTRYSLGVTENEFEQRALLLAQMLGDASVFNMIMQDEEGLLESLTPVIDEHLGQGGGLYHDEKARRHDLASSQQVGGRCHVAGGPGEICRAHAIPGRQLSGLIHKPSIYHV